MDANNIPTEVEDGAVVSLNYTLTVDGEVIDSSEDARPIQFIQGQHQIIRGLEDELYGMTIGDEKEVVVPPENGYGLVDPNNFEELPRNMFPDEIPLEPGVELELKDQGGNTLGARIVEVMPEAVKLDFNHPLAGKELRFNVTVAGLREATNEELEHGHVHDGGHQHSEE